MSEVKLSVLAISVSLIIVGFIIKLAPFGKGQKMIKGLLSLIIVLIITAIIVYFLSLLDEYIEVYIIGNTLAITA